MKPKIIIILQHIFKLFIYHFSPLIKFAAHWARTHVVNPGLSGSPVRVQAGGVRIVSHRGKLVCTRYSVVWSGDGEELKVAEVCRVSHSSTYTQSAPPVLSAGTLPLDIYQNPVIRKLN